MIYLSQKGITFESWCHSPRVNPAGLVDWNKNPSKTQQIATTVNQLQDYLPTCKPFQDETKK